MIRKILETTLILIFSFVYSFKRKNDDIVVFNSYKNEKYNFYSRVLFEYFLKNKKDLGFIPRFVIDDDKLRCELIDKFGDYFIDSKSLSGIRDCLRAKFWVSSCKPVYTNPFALLGRVKINLWHGTPFKKIAIEDKYQSSIKKAVYKYYYSRFFYTLFVSPSKDVAEKFQRSFNLNDDQLVVTGSVIGEMFGESIDSEINFKFSKLMKKARSKKVLYAPTYRDGGVTKFFPFDDIKKEPFEAWLKENDITIFIRPHHLDVNYKNYLDWDGVEYIGSDIIPEITFYLNEFDTLITDYSGILFDYLLTDGKVILLPYDFESYSFTRGVNYSLEDISCGHVIYDYDHFLNALISNESQSFQRDKIKKTFHSVNELQCNKIHQLMKEYND
ncbi:CDP-glycerol glycerophosphotransferase family protein [Photobacterium swingsii]|uniref:CDP-glycerol glycerophosphotransferase family protein n=1 Tax=Photobacterium swingsii TaxID=680026 RepID=UPI00352E24A4